MIFAMMNPVLEPNSCLVDEFHFASSISRADVLYHIREETSSLTPHMGAAAVGKPPYKSVD
jgi:hypothetical protein